MPTQKTCSSSLRCGRTLADLISELRHKRIDAMSDMLILNVGGYAGRWFCMDNRRLFCLQAHQDYMRKVKGSGHIVKVRVRVMFTIVDPCIGYKFTEPDGLYRCLSNRRLLCLKGGKCSEPYCDIHSDGYDDSVDEEEEEEQEEDPNTEAEEVEEDELCIDAGRSRRGQEDHSVSMSIDICSKWHQCLNQTGVTHVLCTSCITLELLIGTCRLRIFW